METEPALGPAAVDPADIDAVLAADPLDLRAHGGADAFLRDCPSRIVLDVLADKWTMLAVSALSGGRLRHGELRRRLDGISPKMLSQTLRTLERHGLVSRTQYPTVPPQVDYELTSLGESLRVPMATIKSWAEGHAADLFTARDAYDRREPPAPWFSSVAPAEQNRPTGA